MDALDVVTIAFALCAMFAFVAYSLYGGGFRRFDEASLIAVGIMLLVFSPLLGYLLMSWVGIIAGVAVDIWLIVATLRNEKRKKEDILSRINKMAGFYELRRLGLPTVPWQEATPETEFDEDSRWTVRTALLDPSQNDQSLPRIINATKRDAETFVRANWHRYGMSALGDKIGMFIFYPFFHADRSGTLLVDDEDVYIEAVEGDLWNLVDKGKVDYKVGCGVGMAQSYDFKSLLRNDFPAEAIESFQKAIEVATHRFRGNIQEGDAVLFEWSLARRTDGAGDPVGDPDEAGLIFYEVRTVE